MRLAVAVTAALLAPTTALACPPPPEGYVPPTRAEVLRERVQAADAIIYATVARSIGPGAREDDGAFTGDPGAIRILHVYKGNLRAGQRLPMYGASSLGTSCGGEFTYAPRTGRTGASGTLFLYHSDLTRGGPLPFYEFLPESVVAELISLGLIESARARGAERNGPLRAEPPSAGQPAPAGRQD